MFNDTMKIVVAQCARYLNKDNAYVYNNFDIVNRFKHLHQNVEMIIISRGETGNSMALLNTEPYPSWENTPALYIPERIRVESKYTPDEKVMLIANGVSVEEIDEFLRNNKCTYVGTTYNGKHESSEYLGMAPLREVSFSFNITPGIFK